MVRRRPFALLALFPFVLAVGCLKEGAVKVDPEVDASVNIAAKITQLETKIGRLESEVNIGGGGDSVSLWIAVALLGLTGPMSVGCYIVLHRSPTARKVIDVAKGKK